MADDVLESDPPPTRRPRRSAALVATGLLAGGIVAGGLVVDAASDRIVDGASQEGTDLERDGGRGGHLAEQPLTGQTAERVTEVALTEYPGATVRRVETDSDGVYEAHLVTVDGERVTVEVGAEFQVTGLERHR